jgi:tetratricopeptide (TPR) repeat protein
VSDDVTSVDSLLAEAGALINVRRYGDAISRIKDVVARAPTDYRPYCEWSRALYAQGNYVEAAKMADQATQLAPNVAWPFRLQSNALDAWARESGKADQHRLGEAAVEAAQTAIRLAPAELNGHILLAQALPLIGDLQGAQDALTEAARLNPNSLAVWITASFIALRAKDWTRAISASRRALAIDPGNYAALNNLGVALRADGQKIEGTRVLAEAARANPNERTARRNLSRAGLNIVRIAVMILLIPVGFIAHVGFGLYLLFAIGSQYFISKNPKWVLRMEGWAAPIALFFARRQAPAILSGQKKAQSPSIMPPNAIDDGILLMPSAKRHRLMGPSSIAVIAIVAWLSALSFVPLVVINSGSNRTATMVTVLALAAFATWMTLIVRRRRRPRGPSR